MGCMTINTPLPIIQRWLLSLCLLAIGALLIAACGDDDGGSSATPTATDSAASPDGSARPTSPGRETLAPATEDVCSFFSEAEAELVVGALEGDPEEEDRDGVPACTWTGELGALTASLQQADSDDDAHDALIDIAGEDAQPALAGDEAFYTSDTSIAGRLGTFVYEASAESSIDDLQGKLIGILVRAVFRLPIEEE